MARKKNLEVIKDLTPTEEEERLNFTFMLLRRPVPVYTIVKICKEKYGVGKHTVHKWVDLVREDIKHEHDRGKPYAKVEQIARVKGLLSEMREPRFKTVTKTNKETGEKEKEKVQVPPPPSLYGKMLDAERLLAELEGNKDPIRVEFGDLRQSVMLVISNMPEDYMQQLYLQNQERKLLLEAKDAEIVSDVEEDRQGRSGGDRSGSGGAAPSSG